MRTAALSAFSLLVFVTCVVNMNCCFLVSSPLSASSSIDCGPCLLTEFIQTLITLFQSQEQPLALLQTDLQTWGQSHRTVLGPDCPCHCPQGWFEIDRGYGYKRFCTKLLENIRFLSAMGLMSQRCLANKSCPNGEMKHFVHVACQKPKPCCCGSSSGTSHGLKCWLTPACCLNLNAPNQDLQFTWLKYEWLQLISSHSSEIYNCLFIYRTWNDDSRNLKLQILNICLWMRYANTIGTEPTRPTDESISIFADLQ